MHKNPACNETCAVCLLVRRAESNGDSLLVQQLAALALRHQGASTAGSIEEAGVDLAVTGQPGEQACPLLQRECQDLHDLNAWHVPPLLHCLRALNPIYPVKQTQKMSGRRCQVMCGKLLCGVHACWDCAASCTLAMLLARAKHPECVQWLAPNKQVSYASAHDIHE